MEYITMCLDSTNKVEHRYVRHNEFIVLNHGLHVSTYTQVIFRSSYTGESIKRYAWWDPIMLTDMIDLLTAIGLSPGGRSTVHIYTQTIHRTIQNKQYIEQNNFG
jgi:hypothetical protein